MSRQSSKTLNSAATFDLIGAARTALVVEGETPDAWVLIARQDSGRAMLLCATPPLPLAPAIPGFRLGAPLVHAATRITVSAGKVAVIACASRGYLGAILCDMNFSDADVIGGYVDCVREEMPEGNLTLVVRRAIGQMMHLAHSRALAEQYTEEVAPHIALRALPPPDSRVAYTAFSADATLHDLWQAYSKAGIRANLLRLRQGATGCGGCGRCCYDSDISVSRFDVESVASHQLSAMYKRNRAVAVAQTRALMAEERPVTHDTLLPNTASLYFAKKRGGAHTGGRQGACIYLGADGLCGAYEGRPLLCRLYICAGFSPAAEEVYRSAIDTIEWYGRALEAAAQPAAVIPPTLDPILAARLRDLATPYALALADAEAGRT